MAKSKETFTREEIITAISAVNDQVNEWHNKYIAYNTLEKIIFELGISFEEYNKFRGYDGKDNS